VIGGVPRADYGRAVPVATADAPVTAQTLAVKADRRRRRGYVWITLVLLLAAVAGGTGWYFGAGPGAAVPLPDVAGSTVAEATETLTAAEFEVDRTDTTDPEIEAGRIIDTKPGAGSMILRGSTVTLVVSTGPRLVPVGEYKEKPEDEVRAQFADFRVAEDSIRQFSDLDEGLVLVALDANGTELGATYPEQRAVQLVVSAGPIPDVTGQAYDAAAADLDAAGLVAKRGGEVFSDTIPAGAVTHLEPTTDPVRVGDTVSLTIPTGPDLVEVPNVVGMTRDEAKTALANAGFKYSYSPFWDALPNAITRVAATTPEAGSMQKRGSTISIGITASG
jgi:beta-lactam-binding protein with PASTA domain